MCFHFHFQTLIQNSLSATCRRGSGGHGRRLWVVQPWAGGKSVCSGSDPWKGSLSHKGNVPAEEVGGGRRATHSCKWLLRVPYDTQQGFGSGCSLSSYQPESGGATKGIGLEESMPVTSLQLAGLPLRKSLVLGQSDLLTAPAKDSVTDWKGECPSAVSWLARHWLGRSHLEKGMSGGGLHGVCDARGKPSRIT